MGTRRVVSVLLAALAMAACGEQQQPEGLAGPSLAGKPLNPAACDPNSLNSQITAYFPGNTSTAIKTLKDQLIAAGPNTTNGLAAGYSILQEIGNLSRNQAVDRAAGSTLAQGIIKCTFTATNFPAFPDSSIYNFAPALNADSGGAFYVRGGTNADTPVQGAVGIHTETPNILSGVKPLTGTWETALSGSAGGKALVYGYRISGYPFNTDPFVYEWATIPPATQFAGGALVALCDGVDPSTAMVHETNIGVLAYQGVGAICNTDSTDYSLTIKDTGWGPRALAARLARVVVDALQPQPLEATALLKSGTGGTATTFKSKFQKKTVETVAISFNPDPPATLYQKKMPYAVQVFVSSSVSDAANGVNGVCVYLTGANNNGVNTALGGNHECENEAPGAVSAITRSILVNGQPKAGFADFQLSVTKTGALTITASSKDATGKTGVIGRDDQQFISDVARTNVKP